MSGLLLGRSTYPGIISTIVCQGSNPRSCARSDRSGKLSTSHDASMVVPPVGSS
jgi:hypothetical protein